jgi:hypothetical protein
MNKLPIITIDNKTMTITGDIKAIRLNGKLVYLDSGGNGGSGCKVISKNPNSHNNNGYRVRHAFAKSPHKIYTETTDKKT